MARLHEYQGKALLKEHGIAVPMGEAVATPARARDVAAAIGGRVVIKVQAWTTSRAAQGGVLFATTPDEAARAAEKLLGLRFGNFPVEQVLVEEAIPIRDEIFFSLTIDDAARAPLLLLDFEGGSGIEERADRVHRLALDVDEDLDVDRLGPLLADSPIASECHESLIDAIGRAVQIARTHEARSLEINPLVTTTSGDVMAADCRITIDDYAVFRHPELGIDIARELDHPPTELERIAYAIEQQDHRGTFYFAQLPSDGDGHNLIGFHGAGGGGSMMSMDAVTNLPGAGFTLANFCDTSGNPSAAKVYRAARVILSQPNLVGYFGSGSGVASQEQFWSAYGLAKAFTEVNLSIPAVIRLGGNSEDRAVEILEDVGRDLPAPIEGYKKDDTPAFCAERFAELVKQLPSPSSGGGSGAGGEGASIRHTRTVPAFVNSDAAYSFPITGGEVWIDHASCDAAASRLVLEHGGPLFKLDQDGKPVPAVPAEEIAGKDSELIACEIECYRAGTPVLFVDLEMPTIT